MYLELLSRHWVENEFPGRLEVLVGNEFRVRHPEFCGWIEESFGSGISLSVVDPDESPMEGNLSLRSVIKNDLIHGDILSRHLRASRPDHILLMYFDHCQVSLARRKITGVDCSGIYFRPSFHYRDESRLTKLRKRILLSAALGNPSLRHLFCLDPYVVPVINARRRMGPALELPDGFSDVPPAGDRENTRHRLGVDKSRSVVLFFGVVSARKGIHEAIEGLMALPVRVQRETTFLIAGKAPRSEYETVQRAVGTLRTDSQVQVINLDRFIHEDEIGKYFAAADLALVTYRRHVGSSNVLIRAASAKIPVVGSNFGLVGRQIRQHRLGIPVETADPVQVARAIELGIRGVKEDSDEVVSAVPPRSETGDRFDKESAARFADENSADRFAETIFSRILQS